MNIVLVRLFAILVIVLSLQSIAVYFAWLGAEGTSIYVLGTAFVLTFVIPFAIAALLWFFPKSVLGKTKINTASPVGAVVPPQSSILIGVTLLGLYALVFGIVDLFFYEARRFAEEDFLASGGLSAYAPSPETVAGRYTNILQITLGMILLVGRSSISSFLLKLRTAGTSAS